MKAYDKYKDSGVEWLGEIPEHWEVKRIKYLFREINERSFLGDEDLLSVSQYTGVTKKSENIDKGDLLTNATSLEGYKKVRRFQLVSNIMLAWNGSLAFSNYDGITSPAYCIYELIGKDNYRYFHYLLKIEKYKAEFKRKSSGVIDSRLRLYTDDFFRIWTLRPSLEEQKAIATFLDEKCGKIDEAISIKEKQIILLKEHRQIIIQEAVTKGIDKNVKLKDSGVDWIGEIPEHWEVKRLKNTMKFSKGLTITKENLKEEGIWCVNYGEVHSKYGFEVDPIIHSLKCVSADYLKDHSASLLNEGDFIFADTSEDIEGSGNFTYLKSNEKVFAGYHTIIGRSIDQYLSRFLAYEIDSFSFRGQIRSKVKGVKVYSITQVLLKNQYVWLPSLKEQQQITCYLDNKVYIIDRGMDMKKEQIEKLKLYKQSLINDVVTGKVRVS